MHPIARLWQYARAYRTRIRLAVVFTILNKLFDVLPEVLIGVAILQSLAIFSALRVGKTA